MPVGKSPKSRPAAGGGKASRAGEHGKVAKASKSAKALTSPKAAARSRSTKASKPRVAATSETTVRIVRMPHGQGLTLPAYQSEGAAGLDLVAAVQLGKPVRLEPLAYAMVPTGLMIELPDGFEAQVRPRSGLAFRHGITVLNSPGTIDADYRGELQVLLINLGAKAWDIERGERIAQLVIQPVMRARLRVVDRLDQTTRGAGGFGSTGTNSSSAPGTAPTSAPGTAPTSAPGTAPTSAPGTATPATRGRKRGSPKQTKGAR